MEIAQIKSTLDITVVLNHYNLKPDKHGMLLCPFHQDKNPSLKTYPETNTFHCFGCGATGDTIEFIQLKEKITKHEAILKASGFLNGHSTEPTKQKPVPETNHKAILLKMYAVFKRGLHSNFTVRATGYLQKRGLSHTLLDIGYNSGQFHHHGKLKKKDMDDCVAVGLLTPYYGRTPKGNNVTYTAFARDCIIFPLKNNKGEIVSIYARSILEPSKAGKKSGSSPSTAGKHFYLKNRTGLYPHYPNPETKKLILTEAIIDAATLLQLKLDNQKLSDFEILSCYGTNGLTEEHKLALRKLETLEEIIFFFDGDDAGRNSVARYEQTLKAMLPDITLSKVITPDKEDVNSIYCKQGGEQLIFLLNERMPFLATVKAPKEAPAKQAETSQLNTSNPYKLTYKGNQANYIIKGGIKKELDSMRVSLDIENTGNKLKSRSKLDLYEDRQVEKISREAAEKLGLRSDLLETDLQQLTNLLDQYREEVLLKQPKEKSTKEMALSPEIEKKCRYFLKQPNLTTRINKLIGESGVTGEENNRLFLFLIASSYKMPDTMHALIQGSTGSGKTKLLSKTAAFVPPESCIRFTRVTESSFYNYDEYFFSHKLICFEDLDGLKEEAQYAVRELQSNELLSSSTSIKTEQGEIKAIQKTVRGPIASLSATTRGEIYEDNMSRIFIIAVDESSEQTRRIIDYQDKKASGIIDNEKEKQATLFLQNCMRTLKPYRVVNPYAGKIQLPGQAHKIRRLHEHYLSFVKQLTLLHQYQREKDQDGRLVSAKEDLLLANEILFESILLKIDELDGSLRQFYERLKDYLKEKGEKQEFLPRDIRLALKVSKTQMHRFLHDLLQLDYIRMAGGHVNKGYRYKIVYWDDITDVRNRIKHYLQQQIDKLDDNE